MPQGLNERLLNWLRPIPPPPPGPPPQYWGSQGETAARMAGFPWPTDPSIRNTWVQREGLEDMRPGLLGRYLVDQDQVLYSDRMNPLQTRQTLLHELAHAYQEDLEKRASGYYDMPIDTWADIEARQKAAKDIKPELDWNSLYADIVPGTSSTRGRLGMDPLSLAPPGRRYEDPFAYWMEQFVYHPETVPPDIFDYFRNLFLSKAKGPIMISQPPKRKQ